MTSPIVDPVSMSFNFFTIIQIRRYIYLFILNILLKEIPYNGEIPGGLQSGKMLRLQGVTHPDADRYVYILTLIFLHFNGCCLEIWQ